MSEPNDSVDVTDAQEEEDHAQTKVPQPCCETPVDSVIDDIGLDDEACSIVIVGGGPHALAALAALHEGSLAFSQYGTDSTFEKRVGFNTLEKVGTICIIDPGRHFNEAWNSRFDALEIQHLRSPAFAHPVAFEPAALLNFAIREGRTSEFVDAPFAGKWLATTDYHNQDPLIKGLPSSALFRDFCAVVEKKLVHKWLRGAATSVCKDATTGKYRVHYTPSGGGGGKKAERRVMARAVILATGPVGAWNVPAPFTAHMQSPLVLHTEGLLGAASASTLREEVTRRCPQTSARVLVIGGGISAAQATIAAVKAGHQVVLRSRRQLMTRPFDIDSKWLDIRHAERLRFEFLSLPIEERRAAVREAQAGGSVPFRYMEELQRLSSSEHSLSGYLRLEVDEAVDESHVSIDEAKEQIIVNGEAFAMVILATGVVTSPSCSPLYQSIEEHFAAPIVDGLPKVDSSLRWGSDDAPDEDLFVMGANAALELGPGGGNLMGAMRAARIVANELHELMWSKKQQQADGKGGGGGPAKARPQAFANPYASLMGDGDGDGSEAESEEDEDDEGGGGASTTSPPPPRPSDSSSAKKESKAELARRKAKKNKKAPKATRGMR